MGKDERHGAAGTARGAAVAEEVLAAGAGGVSAALERWCDVLGAEAGPRLTAVAPQVRRELGTARQAWEQREADSSSSSRHLN